jgi:hypothetical protein
MGVLNDGNAPARVSTRYQTHDFGRHFQGVWFGTINPGLKPWAMVCNRFAVSPADPEGIE